MRKVKGLIILLVISLLSSAIFSVSIYAEENNYTIDDEELYNATNTYNYLYDSTLDVEFNNEARYDLSVKNDNEVSNKEPMITVFTHGWDGDLHTWLSNGDHTSLVKRYVNEVEDANIYVGDLILNEENKYDLKLFDITSEYMSIGNYNLTSLIEKKSIDDISKHIIIVFDGYKTELGNDYIYTQFNYMMSKVVLQVKELNDGILPRINMIGHSRGGLTNMQYALDHPDIVASLYSFGTPYLGTSTAELANHLDAILPNVLGSGLADLGNKDIYMNYVNRWNDNYDNLYSHIRCMALGGVTFIDFLFSYLNNLIDGIDFMVKLKAYLVENYGENVGEVLYDTIKTATLSVLSFVVYKVGPIILKAGIGISFISEIVDELILEHTSLAGNEIVDTISNIKYLLYDIVKLLANEINVSPYADSNIVWNSDVAVNIESQMARRTIDGEDIEYKGFERHYKVFNLEDNPNNIVHMKEATDPYLQNYVMHDFNKASDYSVSFIDDSSVSIVGYHGDPVDVLTIPSRLTINDKVYTVKGINDYAFSDDNYGNSFSEVVIPSTIENIGNYAFSNCKNLTNVDLSNASGLKRIGVGCFCITDSKINSSINSIYLPDNVEVIESMAFLNVSSLGSINIPSNVYSIGEGAFLGTNITSFEILGNNFEWTNDVLINNNVSNIERREVMYANPNVDVITMPDNVTSINAYVFRNNQSINTIYLNEVEVIGVEAFYNSSIENILDYSNVKDADSLAFYNTPWYNALDSEFVCLGNVLLSYNGNDEIVVIPEGVERIGSNAFMSPSIKRVVLPTTINSIGKNAFYDCVNLNDVLFTGSNPPMLDGDCFGSDVILYVGQNYLSMYENNIIFEFIENDILLLPIKLDFYDEDGNYLGTTEEYYQSILDNYVLVDKHGYDFVCFKTYDGFEISVNEIIKFVSDTNLIVCYEKSKYIFNLDSYNSTIEVKYGDTVNISTPVKNGYNFIGWYDENNNLIINTAGVVTYDNISSVTNLYAKYEIIEYCIDYTYDGDIDGVLIFNFTVESPVSLADIPEVKRYGYVFEAWIIEQTGEKFSVTTGIYEDIMLNANWLGVVRSYSDNSITDEYAIIDMTNYFGFGSKTYTISNQVKYVTFIGSETKTITGRIVISTRSKALVLGFENFNIVAPYSSGSGYNTISATSNFDLYISYKGKVNITGGAGGSGSYISDYSQATDNLDGKDGVKGRTGYDGGNGILAHNVFFQEYDSSAYIVVKGGAGGKGGYGQTGQQGSDGVNCPSGSIFNPIKGDDGSDGGDGGTGGLGGDGGYGVCVAGEENLKVSSSSTYRFIGGAGGDGGTGGDGGAGGNGASDESANIWNGVGDPGNGGNGGTGGRGGTGGNGSLGTNALNVYGSGGHRGVSGDGGTGGAAGEGGLAGTAGDDGSNGSKGSNGSNGSAGYMGTSGYNTTGNINSIEIFSYFYNLENFANKYI